MEINFKNVYEIVENLETKYKEGFTENEINSLLDKYKLDKNTFNESLGVYTCIMIDDDIITYHRDVINGIRAVLHKNKSI